MSEPNVKPATTTSVSFAPTPPFVAAFGQAEAARQRAKFDSETNPLLPQDVDDGAGDAFIGLCIVGGVLVGVMIGVMFYNIYAK
jgi:hypothetical protein